MTTAFDPDDLEHRADGVRALARRLVGDEHRAEDVIQQALAAVAVHAGPPVRSPGGWLRGVVRNLSLRARRDDATRRRHEQAAPSRPVPGDPAEVVARAELHGFVVRALLALDEPYRSTLLRRFFDGLSAAEIGREQEVPAATVRTRVHRGLEQLRARLDADHGGRRDWALLLVPLLVDPRPIHRAPAPLVPMSPLSAGVVLMLAKKLTVAAVVLIALAGVWWAATPSSDTAAERGDRDTATTEEPRPRAHVAQSATEVEDPLPEPIDLAAVDRELDLFGRVTDAAGAAVAGARVETFHRPWRDRRVLNVEEADEEVPVAGTRTARDGSFAVRLRRGDRVTLRASHAGFAPTEIPICLTGQHLDVTVTVGVSLTVAVKGPDGAPLRGAHVELRRIDDVFAGLPCVRGAGETDAAGLCRLDGLPPGGSGMVIVTHALGTTYDANVRLADSGESSIEFRLPAGRTISGVVRDAETGEPIGGARVSDAWTFSRAVRTDQSGRFALPNATWQTSVLWSDADGYAEGAVRIAAETDVTIELGRAGVVAGRLLDPEGAPVPDARIAVISDSGDSLAKVNLHGRSGADGRFRIAGLRRGDPHVVIVMAAGLARHLTDTDPAGDVVDLGDVSLPRGRCVTGRAVTATGAPVVGAVVKLSGANADRSRLRTEGGAVASSYGSEETCWTDDRGRFQFTDVAPGEYAISATARGRKNAGADVEVADADVQDVELAFVGGIPLRVHVEDDAGRPVSMVSVTASTADGWSLATPTLADGIVEFDADSRIVSVSAFSWNNGSERYVALPATPVEEGAREKTIVLRRVAPATGTVLRPDGRPLGGATFRVLVDGEVLHQVTPYDPVGYVRATGDFEALVPHDASAVVELVNASYLDPETGRTLRLIGRVEGVSGGDEGLVIHARALPTDRSLDVLVLTPDGLPVPGATVRAHLAFAFASEPLPALSSGRAGRAFFEGLQAAEYTLVAELPSGHPGCATWVPPSDTATPQGQEVVLQFEEGERVAGRVVDAAGAAVGGATIAIYSGRAQLATRVAGTDGSFAFAIRRGAERPLYLLAYHTGGGVAREARDPDFRPSTDLTLTLLAR